VQFEAAGLRLTGWLALPQASRSQADSQYFYLNGRMIRDRLIQHALRQAHQGLLDEGRHPAFVLFLEVDPRQVDVNVHPTKHEVRFREPRLVHDFLQRALREAPESSGERPSIARGGALNNRNAAVTGVAEQQTFYRQTLTHPEATPILDARTILFRRYLLAGCGDKPQLLDIVAAHRYLLQQHLQRILDGDEVRSQPLLIPQSAEVGATEAERVLKAAEGFAAMGFELDRLGEATLVLRRIPSQLRGADSAVLLQVLQRYAGEALNADFLDELVALVPTPETLTAVQGLLRQLETLPEKGKPFWRSLDSEILQRLFDGGGR
jgi:DNA mismatch repair protein MutL